MLEESPGVRTASAALDISPGRYVDLTSLPAEQWLDVVGYEGAYSVSSLGRVRAEARQVGCGRGMRFDGARIRRPGLSDFGHLQVNLAKNGTKWPTKVHRLVLRAFVGEPPAGMVCLHWNGVHADNRMENLRWGTPLENIQDAYRHGTRWIGMFAGERNGRSKARLIGRGR